MATAASNGSAGDAGASTGAGSAGAPAHERPKSARTPAEQEYLDARADDAEAAVKAVRQTIADLEKTLKEREADAKTARAHARGSSKE